MKRNSAFLIAIGFVLASHFAWAIPEGYAPDSTRQDIDKKANAYYRDGEWEKALAGYQYLADMGVANGYLFYNLGNTYFVLGNRGEAILWYERAKRYLPRFEDLDRNLKYARSQLVDEEFQPPSYGGTLGFLVKLHDALNLNESLWLLVLLLWLFSACIGMRLIVRRERFKSWFNAPCWVLGVAIALGILSTGYKIHHLENVTEAVIVKSALDVRTGPGPGFSAAFTLHEGTKVRVMQFQDEWARIVLYGTAGFNGWIPLNAIKTI